MKTIAKTRIEKELKMFSTSPTPGISCTCNDNLQKLTGVIIGAPGTPFENGLFTLDIQIPERYPFEPPSIQFVTPIYHPNIDAKGRICLDTLKLPPQGSWKPHLNLSTVLMMIRVLLGEPGTEDPLMAHIWQEFKYDYPTYAAKAKEWTQKYARGEPSFQELNSATCSSPSRPDLGPTSTTPSVTSHHNKAGEESSSDERNDHPVIDHHNRHHHHHHRHLPHHKNDDDNDDDCNSSNDDHDDDDLSCAERRRLLPVQSSSSSSSSSLSSSSVLQDETNLQQQHKKRDGCLPLLTARKRQLGLKCSKKANSTDSNGNSTTTFGSGEKGKVKKSRV